MMCQATLEGSYGLSPTEQAQLSTRKLRVRESFRKIRLLLGAAHNTLTEMGQWSATPSLHQSLNIDFCDVETSGEVNLLENVYKMKFDFFQ